MFHFFLIKLNSTLETFVDKGHPEKYYCNVDKSDYHDNIEIFTCEDINGTFTACSVNVMFLFHEHL